MERNRHGKRAWLGLVLYVVSYDVWAAKTNNETLSTAFYNSIKHPIKRWPIIALWMYITAHLFKFLPEAIDPLRLSWKDLCERVCQSRENDSQNTHLEA